MTAVETIPLPKPRKKKGRVPQSVRTAAKEYKQAYAAVYGMRPSVSYDGTWIRLGGAKEGVGVKRLRELTNRLRNRIA